MRSVLDLILHIFTTCNTIFYILATAATHCIFFYHDVQIEVSPSFRTLIYFLYKALILICYGEKNVIEV